MDLIRLKNVSKQYKNGVTAIQDLDLSIKKGSFTFVIGGSGSGKSTLIKMLYREERPSKGQIVVGGVNVVKLRNTKVYKLRRKLGIVFQDYRLLPKLTVYENVNFAMEVIGASKNEARAKVLKALEVVGLKNKIHNYPDQLSGGEQQMLAMGRALMSKPKLLLLDEPSMGLSPILVNEIFDIIEEINKEDGVTVLLVEQNANKALSIAHRAYVLETGNITISGDATDVAKNPKVREAYLG